jgi:hypothetical protein
MLKREKKRAYRVWWPRSKHDVRKKIQIRYRYLSYIELFIMPKIWLKSWRDTAFLYKAKTNKK